MVVDHHPVHDSCVVVTLVHTQDISVDTVVERLCRNLDFLLGLADIGSELVYLVISYRNQVVRYEESSDAYHKTCRCQRNHHSLQGYSGSLDGKKLIVLTKLSHRHHG